MDQGEHELKLAALQANTFLGLQKVVDGVERFTGECGDLNHFIRSVDGVNRRISARVQAGRLDALDGDTLKTALVWRVSRRILNRIQADEGTPWEEIRSRLQKEYGGGRWTPEEDALRLFRMTRGSRQSKGDYASQMVRAFNQVADKFRETLPGPEANQMITLVERVARVQLEEAMDCPVTGPFMEEANKAIDRAGRTGSYEAGEEYRREWRMRRRSPVGRGPPRSQGRDHREERRHPVGRQGGGQRRPAGVPVRSRESGKCFSCGKHGHIQARCPTVKCFECGDQGHLARTCPYMRPRRRTGGGEPMEVNLHRPAGRTRRPMDRKGEESTSGTTSGEEGVDTRDTSDGEQSEASYATVVQRGKPRRRSEDQRRDSRE